jgi:hypothetical protein
LQRSAVFTFGVTVKKQSSNTKCPCPKWSSKRHSRCLKSGSVAHCHCMVILRILLMLLLKVCPAHFFVNKHCCRSWRHQSRGSTAKSGTRVGRFCGIYYHFCPSRNISSIGFALTISVSAKIIQLAYVFGASLPHLSVILLFQIKE